MRLLKRLLIWQRIMKGLILTASGVKCNILDADLTAVAVKSGKSLIRFGDGEFGIYQGKDIHYQRWSKKLENEFIKIKNEYERSFEDCPFLLSVPKQFLQTSIFKLMKRRVYVSSWAEARLQFKRKFRTDIVYGDAFLFEKKNRGIYETIWLGTDSPKNIIFVHNQEKYALDFAKEYTDKKVFFVECPKTDAFESLELLESKIANCFKAEKINKTDTMALISAGPAGKVIVLHLSKEGIWCVDTGHCWDDPLEGID